MKDFKSYNPSDENQPAATAQSGAGAAGGSAANGGASAEQFNSTVEMAKIISKAMHGKSTAQILQTIISEAERGKRAGTLTNADLDNFYSALAPLLDGAKKRKLKEVIARLKTI